MAFNPTALQPPTQKPKPVILLLDVSGSMKGSKIETLNDAVKTMIDVFCKEMESSETLVYQVAIFTFGELIELHTPYTPVDELKAKGISHFQARGGTPLGYVLKQAKSMIEDKNVLNESILANYDVCRLMLLKDFPVETDDQLDHQLGDAQPLRRLGGGALRLQLQRGYAQQQHEREGQAPQASFLHVAPRVYRKENQVIIPQKPPLCQRKSGSANAGRQMPPGVCIQAARSGSSASSSMSWMLMA